MSSLHPITQEILDDYQVRKTGKQKLRFRQFIQSKYSSDEVAVESSGKFIKNDNIVIGDFDNATVVLGAHYDTQPNMYIPNLVYPNNMFLTMLYQVFLLGVIMILSISLTVFTTFLLDVTHSFFAILFFSEFYLIMFVFLLLKGPANKHTVNDNTSGVVTVLNIYNSLSDEMKSKACVVLFDNEEVGLVGSAKFNKLHKDKLNNKVVINYDSVSDGSEFFFLVSKDLSDDILELSQDVFTSEPQINPTVKRIKGTFYPSDHMMFLKSIGVAVLYNGKFGPRTRYIHTSRDKVFEVENIVYLRDKTIELIERL